MTDLEKQLDALPDCVIEATAEAIGGAMDCLRVWSAWGVGTMSADDFAPVADDGERVAEIARAAITAYLKISADAAPQTTPGVPDGWQRELLDWVSACQSAYHIDSTPGHRFGGLGSNLEENRAELVAYVADLLAAAASQANKETPK
ncbi:hypothetical protein [Chromobacterium haemolyticum]|uniref:Uncharacterized protein n=1 Tax=Chromobacterium haemolyticum TaxID=394935 RepID=A0A1W0D5L4_9NEIS|nr:hypothetical protein [Chromobacterium haemolyticum]OQS42284.1 hypothetical protein B0T45_05685 [Chromobacterium haemolyticum]